MAERPSCPRCGSELPAHAPQGLCPRCLLRQELDGDSRGLSQSGEVGATPEPSRSPGVLETIARSIGPVPRVLLRDTAPGEEPGPIVRPSGADAANPSVRYRIDGEIARGGMGAVLKGLPLPRCYFFDLR